MKYKVPKRDGEVLCYPPWEQAPGLAETNHVLLGGQAFKVAGTSFQVLRASARRKIAASAGRDDRDRLRIVAGAHQPGFHGPGIAYKYRVLQDLSSLHLSVNFVVDSDVTSGVAVRVPCVRRHDTGLKEILLFPNSHGVVFETLSVPPKRTLDKKYQEIEDLLQSVASEETVGAFRQFRSVHEEVYVEDHGAARILADYQRGFLRTPNVLYDYVSAISLGEEFRTFVCDVVERIEEFHEAHNSSLKEHRRLHSVRSPANPFPDLTRAGDLWEMPFWGLDRSGRRHRLYVGGAAGSRFVVGEGASARVSPVEPEGLRSLRIRPRAVCLTMFLRLFVSDLFVHGVGGGNYDQVTDRIMAKYYGITPPRYLVCSRTRHLPIAGVKGLKTNANGLKLKLRRMRQNPEAFFLGKNALAREAQAILSECKGKPSAEEHRRLARIRSSLLERLSPEIGLTERELARMERARNLHAAFQRRDLPYFLYPPGEL